MFDSDCIINNYITIDELYNNDGTIDWVYCNKIDYPDMAEFVVWKEAYENMTKTTQDIHFMVNNHPFIFLKDSLKNASDQFKLIHNMDYDEYCLFQTNKYNININDKITNIFDNLSKCFSEFEWLGYYCKNYSTEYNFLNKKEYTIRPISSKTKQFWSHSELNTDIITQIHNNLFNLTPLIDNNYINKNHHKYYTQKIHSNNTINDTILPDKMEEKVIVNPFKFIVHKKDTCIADCLRTGILFEKFILSFVKHFIDPHKNILDIGANIGVHSIVYSRYTIGKIYAFEPQPLVFNLLKKNIELNTCNTIFPYNYGASDRDDTFFMNANYDEKINHGAFSICNKQNIGINIECKKIDNLELTNIGYIKIDVEGHELNVLLGLQNTILNNLPNIMIEIHDSSPTKYDVLFFIEKMGYKYYYKLSHCDYIFTFKNYFL
jgi:FkbM family methyltransferase